MLRKPTSASTPRPTVPKAPSSSWLTEQGWPTFVVPDDVGGRYSVLTAVGLLPIACAGIGIDELMQGAADGLKKFGQCSIDNDAYRYAMTRNILYRKGKSVETLACFEPDFTMMNEWYKQLFGESEGKDQKGLMPTSCIFSTDLHSMGQFLQDGGRVHVRDLRRRQAHP